MLELNNLNVYYKDIQALRDVSLSVKKGEIVSLVGSNGSGKTTLLKTISGLVRSAAGRIEFLGESIDKLPPHRIVEAGISHVPEGRKLFPFMTVLENLEMGSFTRESKKKRRDTLEWVYGIFPVLKERRKQSAGTLSGGEQQMLAVGRALMSRPKLCLLDEPSMGLAPIVVRKIFETLKEINAQGITILLVEQNVHHALNLSNRAYVIENGSISLQGEGAELLNNELVRKAYLGL